MNDTVRKAVSLLSAAALMSGMCSVPSLAKSDVKLYINEVCTGNSGANGNLTGAVDKKGEYCDWAELYNAGSEPVNLKGFTLVKDGKDSYAFGDVTIAAGEHKIVYCCKTYNGDENVPHAAFNLSGDGVKLTLKNGDEDIDTADVPALADDTVWGRKTDGGDFTYLLPTPGATNNNAKSAVPCNAPEFSKASGMYADSFELTLSTDEGNKIYYTLDGTDPTTSDTRIEYTGALTIKNRSSEKAVLSTFLKPSQVSPWASDWQVPDNSAIDKGTVIRAVTLSKADEYSEVLTNTYFVGVSNKDHNGLPILSVTTDPDSLYDYETGIYRLGKVYDDIGKQSRDQNNPDANYNRRGKEWERTCHIDFFESDGTLALSQDCGMRTQGAYSRGDYQKSLRFYAREEYGEKNFKYTFFDNAYQENGSGKQLKKFKKLVMRNGGNDTTYTKFKDSYLQSLVSDRAFDTQEGRPCVMYIDGEYWGLYTLQEDYDDHYFEENYDVNSDEVVVYKKGEIDEGNEEDIELFNELRSFAEKNDLSKKENYDKICKMIDVQSFADYMATEIYILNEDWPGNNYAMWRTRTVDEANPYADGRWRMLFYDTEMGVDHYGNGWTHYNSDNLKNILKNNWDDMPVILNALLKNKSFKELFVTTFMDITNINFNYETTKTKLEPFMAAYYPELKKYFARFPSWANTSNASDPCISRMKTFLKNRPAYAATMLRKNLGLSDAVAVSISAVNPDGGEVTLDGSALDLSKQFSGNYFNEYKITLTASPREGYTFKGWAGTYQSSKQTITISPREAAGLQAVFVKDGEKVYSVSITDGTNSIVTYAAAGGEMYVPTGLFEKKGYTSALPSGKVTKDMSVKVTQTPITYTVQLNAGGGLGSSVKQTFTYDKAAALSANKFTRNGYEFVGWATKYGASVAEYKDKQTVRNLSDKQGKTINLYAAWRKKISFTDISIASSSYYYSGKKITPAVTIYDGKTKLKAGTDYSIVYKNNTKIGKATITIKGLGKYTGTKSLTFKIVPKKPTVKKVTSPKKAQLKVTCSKVSNVTGYQIAYSTSSKFTKATTKTASSKTTSKLIKGLKKGTTYYVKMRTYKTVGGVKYYSPYTKVTKIKIKK
ncbi:CotH kinase family protein [Ruminococcus sp. NK3A76]|uniref:CotH kinase family protein n=1 Tax=Ruminococcus sp. NK3A76 TaxID=877411 RepID=UPI00049217B1|nr:CotH kinase family protein [Ruminococcus sp. NK3A76]